jgi:NAD(P)-dependent dehydrogenase (short-subunit alcohol dehydrogenase family)
VRAEQDATPLREVLDDPQDVLFLDVTEAASINAFTAALTLRLGDSPLWGLVNNAGVALSGPVELVRPEEWRRQLEINLIGPMVLTQKLLPLLRESRGRLVNVSSLSGRISTPFMGAYCASKYGLEAATDALRIELNDSGIQVVLIEPGRIKTRIFEKAARQLADFQAHADPTIFAHYRTMFEGARQMVAASEHTGIDPQAVAGPVLEALSASKPRLRYIVGADAHVMVWAKRLLPSRWLDAAVGWVFQRAINGRPI